jgi:CxxC motif-containing protein (DUF1111 family)
MPDMDRSKYVGIGGIALIALAVALLGRHAGAGLHPDNEMDDMAAGRELFTREWLPGDKRSFAGDGLGPVFNARSCVACHNRGGTGGSGTNETNAIVVSAFVQFESERSGQVPRSGVSVGFVPEPKTPVKQPDRAKLAEIHPNLRTEVSFQLPRFGTDIAFATWRDGLFFGGFPPIAQAFEHPELLARAVSSSIVKMGGIVRGIGDVPVRLIPSERNAPALFGAGLIDRIPNRILEEVAAEQAEASVMARGPVKKSGAGNTRAEVNEINSGLLLSGRLVRLKDGRVGRFGWKSQVATLREFTLQACANEIGLEVPGFPRQAPPWKVDYKAPGLDLTAEQCDKLIRFVSSLPAPKMRQPETPQHAFEIAAGQKLFGEIGCAACHRPKLADVDGIYSDLLLHDMGQELSDTGLYSTRVLATDSQDQAAGLPVNGEFEPKATKEKPPKFGAGPREWRTPPLWGLRDSAPYLHDGRADTVADAVAFHGGEGFLAAKAFFRLSPRERQQVELFLQSLAAPAPPQ